MIVWCGRCHRNPMPLGPGAADVFQHTHTAPPCMECLNAAGLPSPRTLYALYPIPVGLCPVCPPGRGCNAVPQPR